MDPSARGSFEVDTSAALERTATSYNYEDLPMSLRTELLEHRTHLTEGSARKNAARLLLLGALCGLFGFVFVFVIGAIKATRVIAYTDGDNYCAMYNGTTLDPCYFPATVSEMVYDPREPTGKVFFCFEFVGAMLIFFSWYPTLLRNVYIGDDAKVPIIGMAWVTFRQYVPAPGMMLLAAVTTVPFAQANILDYFCIGLHLWGAMLMFVGYFLAEAATVGWGPFDAVSEEKRHFAPNGKFYRRWFLHGIVFWYAIFCVLQVVLSIGSGPEFDLWEIVPGHSKPQLVRAAQMPVKYLKCLSYASEVFCGMFLIGSHIFIWYNCEERHYDLPEELLHLPSQAKDLSPELTKFLSRNNQ